MEDACICTTCSTARARRAAPVFVTAIEAAKARGLRIVCDAFEVWDGGDLVACCALGAFNYGPPDLPELGCTPGEWDAFERGFDGIAWSEAQKLGDAPPVASRPWHRLGLRLRARFQPVKAQAMRELEGSAAR